MKQNIQITGGLGEKLAARFLKSKGFEIIETNYRKKWGEIDIVAEKENVLHFVEVKATAAPLETEQSEAKWGFKNTYRPEENIRLWKKQRMARAIKTYLLDRKVPDEKEFLIDVVALNLDFLHKKAKIRFIQSIILE